MTYFVLRTGLGAICLLAGVEKLRAPREFFQGVEQYGLVRPRLAPITGSVLIGAEIVLGGLLVSGLAPVVAALGAIVLFSVFAAALAVSIARDNTAPCHCFGASEVEKISPAALVRALVLVGISVGVLVLALGDTASITRHELIPSLLMATALRHGHAPLGALPARLVVPAVEGRDAPLPDPPRQLPPPAARRPLAPGGTGVSGVWLASYLVLWLVVLVLAFLLAGSLRQLGLMQLRLGDDPGALITDSGLERGAQAPEFIAADSETGEAVALSSLPAVPRLLVFASPGCLSCRELIPGLNEVRKTRSGEFDFLVVCRGDIESCRGFGRMNRLEAPMVVDTNGQIEKDYMVTLTPFAYVLDHEGRVVIRGVANDWRQLESLLDQEGTLQAGRGWVDVDGDGNGNGAVVAEGEHTHG